MWVAIIYVATMVGYFIKDVPQSEKPRERFLNKGARSLNDAELIALILRSGSKDSGVLEISQNILKEFNTLSGVSRSTYEQLIEFKGLHKAKVLSLLAAFELANRIALNIPKKSKIKTPKDVFELTRDLFYGEQREKLVILSLDSRNSAIAKDIISEGTVNSTLVHPREVFRQALLRNAVSIILVHNHPSGDSTPSDEDLSLTQKVIASGKLLEVNVLDHVVVTDCEYLSIKSLSTFRVKSSKRKEVNK